MKILVCGGRNFGKVLPRRQDETRDYAIAREKSKAEHTFVIDKIHEFIGSFGDKYRTPREKRDEYGNWLFENVMIISGGATGVDSAAIDFAVSHWLQFIEYKADWTRYGKSAGMIRNEQMLDENPDIEYVLAFPGGTGTANMVKLAQSRGIEVKKYEYSK